MFVTRPDPIRSARRRVRGKPQSQGRELVTTLGPASVEEIPLERLDLEDTTYQYRVTVRPELLVRSIAQCGIQVPLVVRPHPSRPGRFQILCGFQRARAALMCGLSSVPAIIRRISDDSACDLAVVDNEQRRSLSDLDRAQAIVKLKAQGRSLDEVAALFRLSRRQIQNLQALADFPPELRAAVDDISSGISTTHALALMEGMRKHAGGFGLPDWIEFVRQEQCSVADLRRAIREQFLNDRYNRPLVCRTPNRFTIDIGASGRANEAQRGAAIVELERLIEELR